MAALVYSVENSNYSQAFEMSVNPTTRENSKCKTDVRQKQLRSNKEPHSPCDEFD